MSLFVKEIFKGDTTLEDLKSKPGLIKEIRGRLVELAAIDDKHSWRLEATKDGGDVSVYEAVEEVSTHTITKKYEFQMEMPASEWPQYALSSKFKTFQVTPLGYGNMEAVARGGKKPATYKRTKVLPDALSDGDAENSITNIVHTTGHREKDKEPAWDRLDMFHCAEVFKGIAVMIQVPILHPDVPVRKGIHRNRTVTVLVAKDKYSSSHRVDVEAMIITSIPNMMRLLPRKLLSGLGRDRMEEIIGVVQQSSRKSLESELGIASSTFTPSNPELADDSSAHLGPVRRAKYIGVLNKCFTYLESLTTERVTAAWTSLTNAPAQSLLSSEYRAAKREQRASDNDIDTSSSSFTVPAGRPSFTQSAFIPGGVTKLIHTTQDSFSVQRHEPSESPPASSNHQGISISRTSFYHKGLTAPPLYGSCRVLRAEFVVGKMTPQKILQMMQSKSFWLNFEPIPGNQAAKASVKSSAADEKFNEVTLRISDPPHHPDWIALQKTEKIPGGAIHVSVMSDPLVKSVIQGHVLGSEVPTCSDVYYLTLLCEPRGRTGASVTCVTMINQSEVGEASRQLMRGFKRAANAYLVEEVTSSTDACCGSKGLPAPLQCLADIFLAPIMCLPDANEH